MNRPLLFAAILLVILIAAYVFRVGEDLIDFKVDYRAGQRILQGQDL